jgi:hypothetical protein
VGEWTITRSPRRFTLLASVYGKSAICQYAKAAAVEFETSEFANEQEVLKMLGKVVLGKLGSSLTALAQDQQPRCDAIKLAIASDLIVMVVQPAGVKLLDMPDGDDAGGGNGQPKWNPVELARDYLRKFLSGKAHSVWTCSVILQIPDGAIDPQGRLESAFCTSS